MRSLQILYLVFGVYAVGCEWVTATILGIDDHSSQRADCHHEYHARKVYPHRSTASDKTTGVATA